MFMKDHIERLYVKCKQVRELWLKFFQPLFFFSAGHTWGFTDSRLSLGSSSSYVILLTVTVSRYMEIWDAILENGINKHHDRSPRLRQETGTTHCHRSLPSSPLCRSKSLISLGFATLPPSWRPQELHCSRVGGPVKYFRPSRKKFNSQSVICREVSLKGPDRKTFQHFGNAY